MTRAQKRIAALMLLALPALLSAGCGLKGPLYLPDHKPETASPSAPASQSQPRKRASTTSGGAPVAQSPAAEDDDSGSAAQAQPAPQAEAALEPERA